MRSVVPWPMSRPPMMSTSVRSARIARDLCLRWRRLTSGERAERREAGAERSGADAAPRALLDGRGTVSRQELGDPDRSAAVGCAQCERTGDREAGEVDGDREVDLVGVRSDRHQAVEIEIRA